MNGLMMDYQLTLPTLLRRAETYFGGKEIVDPPAGPELPPHDATPRRCRGARALAVALQRLGLERGDRVATLCWNHHAAPRGVPRHPVRRLRAAHAEPAPAPERPRLHRDARAATAS